MGPPQRFLQRHGRDAILKRRVQNGETSYGRPRFTYTDVPVKVQFDRESRPELLTLIAGLERDVDAVCWMDAAHNPAESDLIVADGREYVIEVTDPMTNGLTRCVLMRRRPGGNAGGD